MKSKGTTIILALLLGGIGGHQFYLGNMLRGFLYLVFCWTFIPLIISIIDALYFGLMSKYEFDNKYNQHIMTMNRLNEELYNIRKNLQ